MSDTSLIFFRDHKPDTEMEFRNSWGGFAYIWDRLFEKYCKDPDKEYDNWLLSSDKLWALDKRKDIPVSERACLVAGYDKAMIWKKNFKRFAGDLISFLDSFQPGDKRICHLYLWVDVFLSADSEAIGFHPTSVAENLWWKWDEEKEEEIPYELFKRDSFFNLVENTEHFEVYEYLDGLRKEGE